MTVRFLPGQLAKARLKAGLTQNQLARAVETTDRNIWRWEKGENEPRASAVVALAKATGRDIDFFYTESDDEDEDEAAMPSFEAALRGLVRQVVADETRKALA